jgi:hypothetical protein
VVELFALESRFTERNKWRADAFGHFDKVFPRVGIAFAFPHDGGDVFGDVARKTDEAVPLDEGHHVVFQRQ